MSTSTTCDGGTFLNSLFDTNNNSLECNFCFETFPIDSNESTLITHLEINHQSEAYVSIPFLLIGRNISNNRALVTPYYRQNIKYFKTISDYVAYINQRKNLNKHLVF